MNWKTKQYHTVGTFQKYNRIIAEIVKSIPLTHKYMTAHFLVLEQTVK
jgi:hypothetical protein